MLTYFAVVGMETRLLSKEVCLVFIIKRNVCSTKGNNFSPETKEKS
jgi:hypothetical protein